MKQSLQSLQKKIRELELENARLRSILMLRDSESTDQAQTDQAQFREAYNALERERGGRGFIRIHRMRERLNMSRETFDKIMADFMEQYALELHMGDPRDLSDVEIMNSYRDDDGMLFLTMTFYD